MSKHPNTVEGLTAEELAKKFARTTYGFQVKFLKELTDLYSKESKADKGRGYEKLAQQLSYASTQIGLAWIRMIDIWKICEPKMEEEDLRVTCPECRGDKDYNYLGQICCPKCYSRGYIVLQKYKPKETENE